MAQRLKPEVRERIVAAAEEVFAADGFAPAKMADIAEVAGISAGNLYRYFAGKDELFHAVVDPSFVAEFDALLDERVQALSRIGPKHADVKGDAAADEMLTFWIRHRHRVVVLLDRCDGSRYQGFPQRFVERLVEMTLAHLRRGRRRALPPVVSFTLRNVFDVSRRSIVAILETYETEAEIRLAFEAFWSFQLAGLAGLEGWVRK